MIVWFDRVVLVFREIEGVEFGFSVWGLIGERCCNIFGNVIELGVFF